MLITQTGAASLRPPVRLRWLRLMPFGLSAVLFLSVLFMLFSPLPLLIVYFRQGRKWAWLAAMTNGALVAAIPGGGWERLAMYLIFSVSLGLGLGELLVRKVSIEKAAAAVFALMATVAAAVVVGYARAHHLAPLGVLRDIVDLMVKTLTEVSNREGSANWMGTTDLEELRQNLTFELPFGVAIFSLVLYWTNIVALIRTNVGGVRERAGIDPMVLRSWKAPAWLVWPTILTGFLVLLDLGPVADGSFRVFEFLLAIYAIQGLSILSFFFDIWNIRGFFRGFGYVVGVFLMLPLLLSLGFFDLWFDFRSKFRQS